MLNNKVVVSHIDMELDIHILLDYLMMQIVMHANKKLKK